jgi:hypothetical protein
MGFQAMWELNKPLRAIPGDDVALVWKLDPPSLNRCGRTTHVYDRKGYEVVT